MKNGLTRSQSIEGHVVLHLLLLITGQDDMKPIANNVIIINWS